MEQLHFIRTCNFIYYIEFSIIFLKVKVQQVSIHQQFEDNMILSLTQFLFGNIFENITILLLREYPGIRHASSVDKHNFRKLRKKAKKEIV